MYEKLSRLRLLGMEDDPPTRVNFSPYKQALNLNKENISQRRNRLPTRLHMNGPWRIY